MTKNLQVGDAKIAKEIAIEASRSMWRYVIPDSFVEAQFDDFRNCWTVVADYFEERLMFRIDAGTGNVSAFRLRKQGSQEQ